MFKSSAIPTILLALLLIGVNAQADGLKEVYPGSVFYCGIYGGVKDLYEKESGGIFKTTKGAALNKLEKQLDDLEKKQEKLKDRVKSLKKDKDGQMTNKQLGKVQSFYLVTQISVFGSVIDDSVLPENIDDTLPKIQALRSSLADKKRAVKQEIAAVEKWQKKCKNAVSSFDDRTIVIEHPTNGLTLVGRLITTLDTSNTPHNICIQIGQLPDRTFAGAPLFHPNPCYYYEFDCSYLITNGEVARFAVGLELSLPKSHPSYQSSIDDEIAFEEEHWARGVYACEL